MGNASAKRAVLTALIWAVLALIAITSVTVAWFSFYASTNVVPMGSTISTGGPNLLISNSPSGPFDTTCELVLSSTATELTPVSTSDLISFYKATAQNRNGISILYEDITADVLNHVMQGTVYLQVLNGSCDVYFNPEKLSFSTNSQVFAAARFGLKITVDTQTTTYIFELESLADNTATSIITTPQPNTVVQNVANNGIATFCEDPSVLITPHLAKPTETETQPQEGETPLMLLSPDTIATVEYWFYLEGCDEHCHNDVQQKDIELQLAFAGVERKVMQ